ncbi:MAG: BON domain-containing protein [Ginsengibacter sp.]
MRDYPWNPYKGDWHDSDIYRDSDWNYDPRDQNYYLGRINESGNNDLNQRYYTDNYSDRYYRRDELENALDRPPVYPPEYPYINNDFEGHKKRNYRMPEGPHRGKGPKNYNRSIERIKEDASDRLMDDSLVDASNIDLDVKDGELILSGTVDTRFEKRRAENLVENVSGVRNVQNNLRVSGNKTD